MREMSAKKEGNEGKQENKEGKEKGRREREMAGGREEKGADKLIKTGVTPFSLSTRKYTCEVPEQLHRGRRFSDGNLLNYEHGRHTHISYLKELTPPSLTSLRTLFQKACLQSSYCFHTCLNSP